MKVYYFTETAFPSGFAATNRIICTVKAIIDAGVDCVVIPYMRTESSVNIINQPSGVFEGIKYQYIGDKNVYNSNILIRKLVSLANFIRCLLYVLKNVHKDDIVFIYHVYLIFAPLLAFVTHYKGAKLVTDVCEIPYGVTEIETIVMRFKRKILMKYIYRLVDGFVAISENLKLLIKSYGIDSKKIIKVPILVDFEKYNLSDTSDNVCRPYFFHAGKLEEQKDGFLSIMKAFAVACKNNNFNYDYYSTGEISSSPHSKEIREILKTYAIEDRFKFLGYLTNQELKDRLSSASCVIINKNKNQQNDYCFSTKLGEYMAAGKAIITTDTGEANNWLTNGVDSIIVPHDNIEKLSQSMILISSDHVLRNKISMGAKNTCLKYFDYHNYGNKLISFFHCL